MLSRSDRAPRMVRLSIDSEAGRCQFLLNHYVLLL